jgi:hypothetical protein
MILSWRQLRIRLENLDAQGLSADADPLLSIVDDAEPEQ